MEYEEYEIDGELFKIQKIKSTIHPEYGKFRTGYRLDKDSRCGLLIIESTIEKVKDELNKVSKNKKIYSRNWWVK